MNKLYSVFVLVGAISNASVSDAASLTSDLEAVGYVGLLSEYSMRGISYSRLKPVVQASATLIHSSGLYAGLWGSNIDLYGVSARYETDYIVGFTHQFSPDVNVDVGYAKYTFPKTSALNATESYAIFTAYGFKVGTYYSDDYFGDQSYVYTYLGYGAKSLPYEMGLDVRYGIADYKDPVFASSGGSVRDSYREWEVKLSKQMWSLDWAASYIDTDLSQTQCLQFQGDKESCSARLLLAVSKSF